MVARRSPTSVVRVDERESVVAGRGVVVDSVEVAGVLLAALMKLYAPTQRGGAMRAGHAELSTSQHAVMELLIDRGAMRVTDLAKMECVALPTMLHTVRRLARAGLVQRAQTFSTFRGVPVQTTPMGRSAYHASDTVKRCRIVKWLEGLTDSDRLDLAAGARVLALLSDEHTKSAHRRAGNGVGAD